jgi:hypothetical protein
VNNFVLALRQMYVAFVIFFFTAPLAKKKTEKQETKERLSVAYWRLVSISEVFSRRGFDWKTGRHGEMEVVAATTSPEPGGSGPRKVLTSGEVAPSPVSFAGGRAFLQSCGVRVHGEAANLGPCGRFLHIKKKLPGR